MLNLTTTSSIYIVIFLPLILSLLCNIFSNSKINFVILLIGISLILFFLIDKFKNIVDQGEIINNFDISILSIALEYKIDIISLFSLIMILLTKFLLILFLTSEYFKKNENGFINKKFHSVIAINIFATIGIILSNNIFNFFIFSEIYSFTILSILSIIKDKKIALMTLNYFIINSVLSMILLITIVIMYLSFNDFQINKLFSNLDLFTDHKLLIIAIFILINFVIFLKFFNFQTFKSLLKSKNYLYNILFYEMILINVIIGLYLIIKFFKIFLLNGLQIREYNYNCFLALIGIFTIMIYVFKIHYRNNIKSFFIDFNIINFGLILIAISIYSLESLRSFFFLTIIISIPLFLIIFNEIFKIKSFTFYKNLVDKSRNNIIIQLINIFIFIFFSILIFYYNFYIIKAIFYNKLWVLIGLIVISIYPYFLILKKIFYSLINMFNDDISKKNTLKNYKFKMFLSTSIYIMFVVKIQLIIFKKIDLISLKYAKYLLSI